MSNSYARAHDRHTEKLPAKDVNTLWHNPDWLIREELPEYPSGISMHGSESISQGCVLSYFDPFDPLIASYFRRAAQLLAARFAVHEPGTQRVEVPLNDGPSVNIALPFEESSYNIGPWEEGFACALISRDTASLERILAARTDVMRSSSSRADSYAYVLVDAIKAIFANAPDAPDLLQHALELTDPEFIRISKDWVLRFGVPRIELLFHLMVRDEEAFDKTLAFAVQQHRKWYSRKRERYRSAGFLALQPLAIACMAHDAGMNIRFTSDYLPMNLIRGDFPRYLPIPDDKEWRPPTSAG